jgi:hypothetical protein
MPSHFAKMVDDAVHEQLLAMGLDYAEVVKRIDLSREHDGCVIRMAGHVDDVEIIPTDDAPTPEGVRIVVRRKLEIALRGIDPFKTQAF